MNNNINFESMTGQTINNNIALDEAVKQPIIQQQTPVEAIQPVPTVEQTIPQVTPIQNVPDYETQVTNNTYINPQQQIQNIPTVEQTKQIFIENTQATNTVKQEKNKEGPNITFIIILFGILFVSIFFIFPYIMDILG